MLCQNGLFSSAIHCSERYSSYSTADSEMYQINFMSESAFLKWGRGCCRTGSKCC